MLFIMTIMKRNNDSQIFLYELAQSRNESVSENCGKC